jgi:hypothetical protein
MTRRSLTSTIVWSLAVVALVGSMAATNANAQTSEGIVMPEPSMLLMLGLGGAAIGARKWWVGRRRHKQ